MTDPSSQRRSGPSGSSRRDYPDRSVLGGEIGIWSSDLNRVAAPQAREAAVEIEELGYAALWFGEALGREAFTNASLLLCATSQLVVATGIANIRGGTVSGPVAVEPGLVLGPDYLPRRNSRLDPDLL
jgi:hypothetical protein